MAGIFTISLDFELHWGVFDKKDRQSRKTCYLNTLQSIPEVLQLFAQYDVHATWAVVGGLMAKDQQEWEEWKPQVQPDYTVEKYSPYKWVHQNSLNNEYQWAHFAPLEIETILKYPGQELGTHTFSHYYCLEQLKGADAFDADLKAAKTAALKYNRQPASLVFPRNQFNPSHLKICYENGIKTVRSNPLNWFWSPIPDKGSNTLRKIFRTGDAYVPMSIKRMSYPLDVIKVVPGQPLQLPASRLFRPWSPRFPFANKLTLRRTLKELHTAARRNECYHLWWHPENFGDYPRENIQNLRILLQHYKQYKDRYGMKSWNMGEYADHLTK
ncbi:MAG TPA: polysaccharide deacetylase family protein [Chitinophagaceae bacterium]|nr:polysaccharide deacetylase family protein [Chitinophagaceae bacterium]